MSGTTNSTRQDILDLIVTNVTSKTKSDRVTTEGLSEVLNCIVNELGCEIDGFLALIQANEAAITALDTSFNSALSQEIANRIAEDANLLSQIQVLDVNVNNAITLVANNLAQEILDRAAGDAALQVLIDANSTAITANDADILALQGEDSNLQAQITTNDNELTLQQNQIVANDADIAALQADSLSLQTQVSDNDADISALQNDVSSNTSNVATNSANIAQNTADIADLQSEDASLQAQITSNDGDIATLQGDVSSNDADIAALQSEDINLQTQISDNDTDITVLQTDVASNDADISALQAADVSLQDQITDNDGEILSLQNQVGINVTDIASLQTDNANLQTQINTNDAELNSQQLQITANDADIAALQSQVSTLNTGFVVDVELSGNDLRLLDTFNNVVGTPVDLSVFLDNTNLARIVTASLNQVTGLVDFVRDDGSDFCLDLSPLQAGAGIQTIVAGANITIDATDPQNPIINATGGGSAITNTSELINDGSDGTSVYVEQDELGSAASANVGDFATAAQGALAASALQSVVAGTNITIDSSDPQNPIINSSGGGGGQSQTTGTFAPTLSSAMGVTSGGTGTGYFVKNGNQITIWIEFENVTTTNNALLSIVIPASIRGRIDSNFSFSQELGAFRVGGHSSGDDFFYGFLPQTLTQINTTNLSGGSSSGTISSGFISATFTYITES